MSTNAYERLAAATRLLTNAPPALLATIGDAVHNTLNEHGLDAFAMLRNAALAHEIGHAIVGTHEGLIIRKVSIFAREVRLFGQSWGGWATEAGSWRSDTTSSAEADLSRARVVIAGLAGEVLARLDRPGSSLDELVLSQALGCNAAAKRDVLDPSDDEFWAYAEQLWHEQVWLVAWNILCANEKPFNQLAHRLHEKQTLQGAELRRILTHVQRIPS